MGLQLGEGLTLFNGIPPQARAAKPAQLGGPSQLLLEPGAPALETPGSYTLGLGPEGLGGTMRSNRPPSINVLPTTGPMSGAAPAYSLPMGPQGQGGVMLMNRGLRPADFNLAYLAEHPQLLGMWNEALRQSTRPGMDNAYTRYLDAIGNGTVTLWTSAQLDRAFSVVNGRFLDMARAAGYDLATTHHWNFPKANYWQQLVDPRQLVPLPGQAELRGGYLPLHQGGLHPLTTAVPGRPTTGPVAPVHVRDLPIWMSILSAEE